MRGKKAKAIRKYVRERFPFLSPQTKYIRTNATGVVSIQAGCSRYLTQKIKDNYKSRRLNNGQ